MTLYYHKNKSRVTPPMKLGNNSGYTVRKNEFQAIKKIQTASEKCVLVGFQQAGATPICPGFIFMNIHLLFSD